MIKFLDLYQQYLSIKEDIDRAIKFTIQNSSFIGGNAVKSFEENFAEYQHAKYCVGVANGTDALEIAIEALALPIGTEIIVPANSFIATSEAVTRSGYRVVFADIDTDTFTLDIEDVSRRISKKTSAIIAVHLYGHPCDMDGLRKIVALNNLKLIEDCAQAHGAVYKEHFIGALGNIGTFSFYPGKNLGAYGDAGAILTNDLELAKRCRMISNHGRIEKYNHVIEGRNSRLDGLQAAILNVKLKYLELWIVRRNNIAQRYINGLYGINGLELPLIMPDIRHAFHLFVIRTKRRDELKRFLLEHGIETAIHYPIALPKLEAYAYLRQSSQYMKASVIDSQLLSLPIGEHLANDDVDYIVKSIRSFFEN